MSTGRSVGADMTARDWAVAAVAWLVLVAALLVVADGQTPVTGTVAAAGVVFLVANARGVAGQRPTPFIEGASARAETLLGASLVASAIASALDHLALFIGFVIVALMSAVWVAMSFGGSKSSGRAAS
jgi:hypothetical protein